MAQQAHAGPNGPQMCKQSVNILRKTETKITSSREQGNNIPRSPASWSGLSTSFAFPTRQSNKVSRNGVSSQMLCHQISWVKLTSDLDNIDIAAADQVLDPQQPSIKMSYLADSGTLTNAYGSR
jgi:hypothetical protein